MFDSGFQYRAFISYCHQDERWATWLHRRLERFRVPRQLRAELRPAGAGLRPIFRDKDELASGHSLSDALKSALTASEWLIVICSPAAAASTWVNEEIRTFRASHPAEKILCFLVDGEPANAFPPALLEAAGSQPLAADPRDAADGPHDAMLRIAARLLDVRFDQLRRRDAKLRQQRLLGITSGALAAVILMAGLALYANEQRVLASEEATTARLVTQSLIGLFRSVDPGSRNRGDVPAGVVLQQGRQQIEDQLAGEPEVLAEVLEAIGSVYTNLGLYSRSVEVLTDARTLAGELPGAAMRPSLAIGLAEAHWRQGSFETAEDLLARLAAQLPADAEPALLGELEFSWGNLEWSRVRLDAAAAHLERALEHFEVSYGRFDHRFARAATNLGNVYAEQRRFDEAEPLLQESLEIMRLTHGDEHIATATVLSALGMLELDRNDYLSARDVLAEAVPIFERVLEPDHPNIATNRQGLARAMHGLGEYEAALSMIQAARASRARSLGEDHPFLASTDAYMSLTLVELGRAEEALRVLERALATVSDAFGEGHPAAGEVMIYQASALKALGRQAESRAAYEAGVAILSSAVGADDPGVQELVEFYAGRP